MDSVKATSAVANKLNISREDLENIIISDCEQNIFDLEYNRISLVLRALNTFKTATAAAAELNISERSVFRYMSAYNIKKQNSKSGVIYAIEKSAFRAKKRA